MSGTEGESAAKDDGDAALDAELAQVQIALAAAAVARLEAHGHLQDVAGKCVGEQSAYCYNTEWIPLPLQSLLSLNQDSNCRSRS